MLLPLAQTFAELHPDWWMTFQVCFDIAAAIGAIVILLVIIGAVSMLPDFFRYLHLKSL